MNYIKVSKLIILIAALLAQSSASVMAADVKQEEKPLIVAAVRGGAWKCSAADPSVRSSVKAGDTLRSGDRLETFQDNEVQVALDDRGQSLIAVQGSFKVRQNLKGTDLYLDRGRALAVLDGLKGKSGFSISTPTGVAVVRGTRFGIEAPISIMDVKTFKGEVSVQSTHEQTGRLVGSAVSVLKGHKTRVTAGSKETLATAALSALDYEAYQKTFTRITAARKSMRANGHQWFSAAEAPPSSVSVPISGNGSSSADKEPSAIVF